MLIAALRDLQWRRQRFLIAIVGTGVVFAATLVLTGLANGFRIEAQRTVDALGLDTYVIKSGGFGPFLGASPFAAGEVAAVSQIPGVALAVPIVYSGTTMMDRGSPRNVNMFGVPDKGPGMPALSEGRPPSTPDEVVVADKLGRRVGDQLQIASRTLNVVGIVHDSTALAGQPNIFLSVAGAQQLMFGGQPLVSSIGVKGTPASAPAGFRVIGRADAIEDFVRPLRVAYAAFTFMSVLLWVVASLIVGSVIYLSALERTRDFAVFKAVGVSTLSVLGGLTLQSVIVSVLAAVVGGLLSLVIGPLFPIHVVVPAPAFVALLVVGIVVGLIASAAGLRRTVSVDPALAFGGP
ncbi:MAG: ABC transporter permease [Mycobacteriaceae bacterium]|nr:ABC transporter permease [Mycobacteriaceae bacterium]